MANENVNWYLNNVVKSGDEGSALLAKLVAPTLENSDLVDVIRSGMNGITVLRVPEGHDVVVHSGGGEHKTDVAEHAASMVERLVRDADDMGVQPVAFADEINSNDDSKEMLHGIAEQGLVPAANKHGLAIVNGEWAILGAQVNPDIRANIIGTMISIVKTGKPITSNTVYARFNPQGKVVYANCDGIGTKTEFPVRSGQFKRSLEDSLAMKLDDLIKLGAIAQLVSDVVETRGDIPFSELQAHARALGERFGFEYVLQHEPLGDRIRGYKENARAFNVGGTAVSVIDEQRLQNPLAPSAGDYLIAIHGEPNPRANGISAKRRAMVAQFGEEWHETPEGQLFMDFLGKPSIVLYPVFRDLINEGLATSVYHMSGGAYEGKLARPLAQHGLYVAVENLFPADWRERAMGGFSFTPAEVAYAQWPMGNDGFVATSNPQAAMEVINKYDLEAREVGKLEQAKLGKTGVQLTGIKSSDGEKDVYYSGRR